MSNYEISLIGLGRMGQNMAQRMLESKKIKVRVWNRNPDKVKEIVGKGAFGAESVEALVNSMEQTPKIVWIMLPAGDVTENVFQELLKLLNKDDIIVEGANSFYKDSIRRHQEAKALGINFLDVGVSGGIVAAQTGYPLMAGGDQKTYDRVKPILQTFGIEGGVDLVGGPGSGHYVKMIHNAIEYGMMQSISEGFDLLKNGSIKDLNLPAISHLWNHGTIVSSFLMQMVENALNKGEGLDGIKPYVQDSGEGKWSVKEAIDNNVPFVANSYALQARFQSRDADSYSMKLLAAMRNEFGGHAIKKS